MIDALQDILAVVNEQAKDEGLWFISQYATEAYLQQELRRLHSVIEADGDYECEAGTLQPFSNPPAQTGEWADKILAPYADTVGAEAYPMIRQDFDQAHNASLAAAQRNEKLWRAEWEQISETARVLQEKLAAERERCLAIANELEQFQYKQVLLQLKNITVELRPPDQALLDTDRSEYIRQSHAYQSRKKTRDSAIRELERIAEETQ